MKYILIWWISVNYGIHTGSVEFDTPRACASAQTQMLKQGDYPNVHVICAAKGDTQ